MPEALITIDGSQGEGGGQILRTSLALSLVTGTSFRIGKIRAGREKPGLLRQHLTAVQAATEIGGAQVTGAAIGSGELTFTPGPVRPGEYAFAVGTAGSATLVLQTVLPALLTAAGPSRLTLEGGTHNPFAPPFDFLQRTFLPLVERMGPRVTTTLDRPGFYPAGGGQFRVEIAPAPRLARLDLMDRGEIVTRRARAIVAGLPRHVAIREGQIIERKLGWDPALIEVVETPSSRGPGNVVLIEIGSDSVTEVFTGFGERGVKAEAVAERVVGAARRYLAAGVPVGEHLADQLLLPMALAGAGSFRTMGLSPHARTNIEVIQRFLAIHVSAEAGKNETIVRVGQAAV